MWTGGEFDDCSVNRNQAKPSRIISTPIRLSGRRRHAYRPMPMKLQPTAGPKMAHTAGLSTWSLASATAAATAPASSAAITMAMVRASADIAAQYVGGGLQNAWMAPPGAR